MSGSVHGARPVVGITAYAEPARWRVWEAEAVLVPRAYVDQVAAAGGVPVVLPPQPDLLPEALARVDAVLLAGGPDVDPARYGAEAHPLTGAPAHERDLAEVAALAAATDPRAPRPLLAVCRGMQLLNVLRGGTLRQHLPDDVGHDGHAPAPGTYGAHRVRLAPASALAAVLGAEAVDVPSYHHQGIGELGSGLVASAWADDGTVEALEDPSLPFCLGVQWHPEVGADPSLFEALVAAARR